ncbi:DNA repair protein RecO [uncultured Litoreibacter sp.]|uniref:DNA repair protein RecO n=1 Tax=uncultured Litoreibacter sp. TaxID=1392394 RepID=UPI00260563E6|nr:DNA repair protein RecO [uncultured Litoreibacter sp.]
MEWRGQGILLSVRRHGEHAAIVEVFTRDHGVHAGVVRGGTSRKLAPVLQPGAQLDVSWRARLQDHLGAFTVEPVKSRAAQVMGDRQALAGLNAVCGLLCFALGERDPHPELYDQSLDLFDRLGSDPAWPLAYMFWELALLEELGFGLDLESCAVTGETQELTFVSPKSGRAVSAKGAGDWADRLLPLPPALRGLFGQNAMDEVLAGLRITGHFLEVWMAPSLGNKPVPAARQRLVDVLSPG